MAGTQNQVILETTQPRTFRCTLPWPGETRGEDVVAGAENAAHLPSDSIAQPLDTTPESSLQGEKHLWEGKSAQKSVALGCDAASDTTGKH